MFNVINGCSTGTECVCLVPVHGWPDWSISRNGYAATNRHGVAALGLAPVFGCDQLVIWPNSCTCMDELLNY